MAVDEDGEQIPVRPSAARVERLQRLAEVHDAWVSRHLAGSAFRPEGRMEGSDYGQHYLDLEATPEQLDELLRAQRLVMGLDPETGT